MQTCVAVQLKAALICERLYIADDTLYAHYAVSCHTVCTCPFPETGTEVVAYRNSGLGFADIVADLCGCRSASFFMLFVDWILSCMLVLHCSQCSRTDNQQLEVTM